MNRKAYILVLGCILLCLQAAARDTVYLNLESTIRISQGILGTSDLQGKPSSCALTGFEPGTIQQVYHIQI